MKDIAENEYFATIMQKLPVYDGKGIINYSPVKCSTVYYDEKTNMYLTEFGEEYLGIDDFVFGTSEESYGVFFLKKVKDLIDEYPNATLDELKFYYADEYSNLYCSIIYNPNETMVHIVPKNLIIEEDDEEDEEEFQNSQSTEKPTSFNLQDYLELVMSGKLNKEQLLEVKKIISEKKKQLSINKETLDELEQITKENLSEETYEEKEKSLNETFKIQEETYDEPFDYSVVCNNIKKAVIGQDEVIESLVSKIHMQLSGSNKKLLYFLTGPSGCGKTEIGRQLAKNLNRDFVIVNIGPVTSSGYVGESVSDIMYDVYKSCGSDIKRCEKAIVLLDELDKKGKLGVNGTDVQEELLPIIEGCETKASSENGRGGSITFNTSNMIFLGTGAFTDVHKITKKKNNSIGFAKETEEEDSIITKNDCINYGGMKEEFMNRCSLIEINKLEEKDLKEILLKSSLSPIENIKELFKKQNTDLVFTEEFINGVAKKAKKSDCGARILFEIIENSTDFPYRYAITDNMKTKKEITITENTLLDNKKFDVEEKDLEKPKVMKL